MLLGATLLSANVAQAGKPCQLDAPTVTCIGATQSSITLNICAGPSGAPAGISIHWSTCAQYIANGNHIPDPSGGGFAISLSGNCQQGNAPWNLGPNACKTITINANTLINAAAEGCGSSGNTADLLCNTCYAFQVFAHNDPGPNGCNKSDLSVVAQCNTSPCVTGECTLTWGYWKTHGPAGCNPPNKDNLWPVSSLTIGGLPMNADALCSIFQTNPGACAKGGSSNGGANAVIILEHQLIAAMMNVANGAIPCSFASAGIANANALLDGFENACVGTSTPLGQEMVQAASLLETYNSDQCTCPVQQTKPQASPTGTTSAKHSSWGQLKSIYR
jgi:hypothetical protein